MTLLSIYLYLNSGIQKKRVKYTHGLKKKYKIMDLSEQLSLVEAVPDHGSRVGTR